MGAAGSKATFKQAVHVEVVRASPLVGKHDYLKKPVKCDFCGNDRRWLIRCEYCGRTEQRISLEALEENS